MGKRSIKDISVDELKKAYKENEDFKEYVDKSKFSSLDIAFQNMMVKYYYLYLQDREVITS